MNLHLDRKAGTQTITIRCPTATTREVQHIGWPLTKVLAMRGQGDQTQGDSTGECFR